MTNYRSPSFDTRNGLFVVDAHPSYGIYFAKPADGVYGWQVRITASGVKV